MVEWKTKLNLIIASFILIILGVIFVSSIADSIYSRTTLGTVEVETFNISLSTNTVSFVHPDILSGTLLVTQAGSNIELSNFTIDYTLGTIKLKTNKPYNNTFMNSSYTYYPSDYVKDGASRSIIGLITLLFTIGLVLGTVYYVRKEGLF